MWLLIPWQGHSRKFDSPGGPHRRIGSPEGGGHTLCFNPVGGVTLWDLSHIHVHLNDPAGGATSEDQIPREGQTLGSDPPGRPEGHILGSDPSGRPHRGICFQFEYLGEFEYIFEMALGYESRGCGTSLG